MDSKVALWDRSGDRVCGHGISEIKNGDLIIDALPAAKKLEILKNEQTRSLRSGRQRL